MNYRDASLLPLQLYNWLGHRAERRQGAQPVIRARKQPRQSMLLTTIIYTSSSSSSFHAAYFTPTPPFLDPPIFSLV